jgi:hypothetical protein
MVVSVPLLEESPERTPPKENMPLTCDEAFPMTKIDKIPEPEKVF